jgi:hypothetical protein
MARSVDFLDFTMDDFGPVLAEARSIAQARDGWVNLRPRPPEDADEEQITEFAPTPPIAPVGLFARWRNIVVKGTWVPGKEGRNGAEDASVGLEHPAGRFAVRQLRDAAHPVPDGWRVVVDHARRGLVLAVPDGPEGAATHVEEVLRWLPGAAAALAPWQVTGRWRAEIHRR